VLRRDLASRLMLLGGVAGQPLPKLQAYKRRNGMVSFREGVVRSAETSTSTFSVGFTDASSSSRGHQTLRIYEHEKPFRPRAKPAGVDPIAQAYRCAGSGRVHDRDRLALLHEREAPVLQRVAR
jgi:hypothetical protein